jgi:hypothetical protein
MTTQPVNLFRGANSSVSVGGTAVIAVYGPAQGGLIVNPQLAGDQGISVAEVLYIDLVNPAVLHQTDTCIPLQPGEYYRVPHGCTTNITVNAATSGHKFSVVTFQPPPVPVFPDTGGFPPAGPTSLQNTINSYLYIQYNDDDDLQAFVDAYNILTQEYITWFNTINLPIYTNPNVSGTLLDWVLTNLYGQVRPALSSGRNRNLGPLNTYALNVLPPNVRKIIGSQDITATSDDFYRRIATWNFYKGDGKVVNVRWLKRRIMRFLLGANGIDVNPNTTYQVSVTFGLDGQVNITLVKGRRTVTGGAVPGRFAPNTKRPNELDSFYTNIVPLQNGSILKEAIDSGVLQLPFQFTYVVNV